MLVEKQSSLLLTYVATRPEVEGFRDQDFVLQYYLKEEALKFHFAAGSNFQIIISGFNDIHRHQTQRKLDRKREVTSDHFLPSCLSLLTVQSSRVLGMRCVSYVSGD